MTIIPTWNKSHKLVYINPRKTTRDNKIYKDIHQSRQYSARLEASSGLRNEGVPSNNHEIENQGLVFYVEVLGSPFILSPYFNLFSLPE